MPVIATASDGLDISVLLFPHEWSASLTIAHRFPGIVTAGQSGREGRRPKAEDLRHTLALHLVIEDEEAHAFRQLLATLGKGWVAVPLWLDQYTGADWADRVYDAQRLWDFTSATIVAHDAVLDPAHEYAPLFVGHITELPPLGAETATIGDFSFNLVEDSPWLFRVDINAAGVAGTWPAGLEPDWGEAGEDKGQRALVFNQVGDDRTLTIDNEESVFTWGQTAPFTFKTAGEIRTLLAFFRASGGLWKKFDSPWWFKPGTATAETPTVTKARFGSDTLTLEYLSPGVASAKVEVLQVPWEIVGVEGEDPEQPPRVFLYKFVLALPEPLAYRFTNWPRTITRAGDGDYLPAPMKHREITDTLDVKSNKVVLDSFNFTGNPLQLWTPDEPEAPLVLTIMETETWPIDPSVAVVRFIGEVKRPKRTSRVIEAPAFFLAGLLEREFPRVRVGPNCNTTLFTAQCGLDRAAYRKTGTFTAAAGCQLTIATAAGDAADAFALGKIEIGAGATFERREIIASEPTGGGQLITVDWPVRQAAAAQAVVFYPGCARTGDACRAYGNYDRFGGHEHIPQYNLSLPTMAAPSSPGKK